ncbi:hypothetical protein Caci_3901 [Catenulispora acidiphila DSM 44928]|uniref:Uncharacterized protein n=1 Tax=Catenulispora acidiphila (strain DSM 44928 / JCM 14897 / NBRC 102108 / NRRL B-24433 / ID139908) TaxID=479433 RepID=C7QEL9_CATAD|nr:hypothetical protein Caci_3901 [Catenulispora acidiphila DSM 44928]
MLRMVRCQQAIALYRWLAAIRSSWVEPDLALFPGYPKRSWHETMPAPTRLTAGPVLASGRHLAMLARFVGTPAGVPT